MNISKKKRLAHNDMYQPLYFHVNAEYLKKTNEKPARNIFTIPSGS